MSLTTQRPPPCTPVNRFGKINVIQSQAKVFLFFVTSIKQEMMPQNVMKQLDDKIDTTLTSLLLI